MASSRKRSATPPRFQGREIAPDLLVQLWNDATHGPSPMRSASRERIARARGLRLKQTAVALRPSWVRRHPEAADWVVKYLPERRTLERDLIAAVASVEPTYSRTAIGFLDRDRTNAEACENYLETWRSEYVPFQTFAEKATEDGEFGVVVLPTDVDMEGYPDFYDRLSSAAYDALPEDDERREAYTADEDDPKGRYAAKDTDGNKQPNPAYDRDARGRPRPENGAAFSRDDEKSKAAHAEAVRAFLLKQEQGAVTVRVVPAADCVPFLMRGTKRERWKLFALLERTLYWPEELLAKGYGWRGMGDAALIPKGQDATRSTGQNGQFYLYALYTVWCDPDDPKKAERPLVAYSVAGQPTWHDGEPDDELPEGGVAVIDLYESHGLEGPFWWYGGGLHTSDDDPDYYWEPYLWPLAETILSIEGIQTAINAATAVSAFTGYYHRPDASLLQLDSEALIDAATGELRKPLVPESGEIETVLGEIIPATPATVSGDAWRVIDIEYASLRANTALEAAGAGATPSGHAMVVKETIAQTAKRHIREGAADAVRFCGESAMKIFTACDRQFDTRWPIQTTKERPVGSELREASDVLEWSSDWVGEGEYGLACDYPSEYNPVKVETAISAAERGYGSPEEVWDAMGITDHGSQWAKILKWGIRRSPAYMEARATQVAKQSGDKLMVKILALQQQQRMTQGGGPGFEQGIPTAALAGPGEPEPGAGVGGGPTAAQSSLGGMMSAQTTPAMNDARAQSMIPGAA